MEILGLLDFFRTRLFEQTKLHFLFPDLNRRIRRDLPEETQTYYQYRNAVFALARFIAFSARWVQNDPTRYAFTGAF